MSSEHFFWAEKVAEEITKQRKKEYVCEGMWSPSGFFHIGNARPEVFVPHAVYHVLVENGFKARQNLIIDDFDPIDKIPAGIPVKKEDEGKFIGVPCKLAPSPFKGHKSWADYFTSQFSGLIESFGIDLNVLSAFDSYKKGKFNDLIVFSLNNSEKIVSVWNKIAGTEKPLSFLPIVVTCEQCGKSLFTNAIAWDRKKVQYECKCGFKGAVSPLNGKAKLHWRVHWVANWIVNDVAFESGGKDHFSKGGSVDMGRALMQEVFNKQPPFQIATEFVQLHGAKISGSVGNVITLPQWLEVAAPELLRFMFFSYKPNTAIDFSFSSDSFVLLNERFERAERIFFGAEKAENEKLGEKIKQDYGIALIGKQAKEMPVQLPFSFAVFLAQLFDPVKQFDEILPVLQETGHIERKMSKNEEAMIKEKLQRAKVWVEKYAPLKFKMQFLQQLDFGIKAQISPEAKKAFSVIAEKLPKIKNAAQIQQAIFDSAKESNVQPMQLFKSLYLVLLGKESGPKLGSLIIAFGKEKCINRIKEAAA